MKKILLLTLVLVSSPSFASISDKDARDADIAREGNLQEKALQYYQSNLDPSAGTCGPDYNQKPAAPDYRIIHLTSSSGVDKPYDGEPPFSYTATYLVVKSCFGGATGAGADRSVTDAAVVQAERYGVIDADGAISPTRPDKIKKLRNIDPSELAADYGQ